jgi:hypothetical protein
MDEDEAKAMMWKCFGSENQAMHNSQKTHQASIDSYVNYLSDFKYVNDENRDMSLMRKNSLQRHIKTNRTALWRLYGKEGKVGHA